MHGMIFYFSGTGNSRWIAEQLAVQTGDRALSIPALTGGDANSLLIGADSRVGIVFPIYAWGAPLLVERFCRRIRLEPGAYAYAVCTCGDEAGLAMRRLQRIVPFAAAWSFAMPNNYIPGFDVDNPALVQRKIAAASERLPAVAARILAREAEYDVRDGSGAWLKTALIRPMFNTFARRTKPFYATNDCNGCARCERDCPMRAITMEQGKPVWVRKHCAQCMACINRCPTRAIQYGAGTKTRGRYSFPDSAQ